MDFVEIHDPLSTGIYRISQNVNNSTIVESDLFKFSKPLEIRVILVRHGETFKNLAKSGSNSDLSVLNLSLSNDTGSSHSIDSENSWDFYHLIDKDSKINERGEQQAQTVGTYLCDQNISKVYTSDVIRAIQTGRIIAGLLNVEVEIDTDLHYDDRSVKNRSARLIRLMSTLYSSSLVTPVDSVDSPDSFGESDISSIRSIRTNRLEKTSSNNSRILDSLNNLMIFGKSLINMKSRSNSSDNIDILFDKDDLSTNKSTVLFVTHNQTLDALFRMIYGYREKKTKYENCSISEIKLYFSNNSISIHPIYFNKIDHLDNSDFFSAARL